MLPFTRMGNCVSNGQQSRTTNRLELKVLCRNLRIAVNFAVLGALLLTTTVAVGVGGWRALARTHELQLESVQSLASYAQAADTARVAKEGATRRLLQLSESSGPVQDDLAALAREHGGERAFIVVHGEGVGEDRR
jgi:hypothetical protein